VVSAASEPRAVGFVPAYARLLARGELVRRVEQAWRHLEDCDLRARDCRVDRRVTIAGAACRRLRLPLVYNTGGHDSLAALALLDGIVDIYLPDMKYGDPELARRYSKVRNYVEVNQAAVREMHRQVGDLLFDDNNLTRRGLLVRHLVLAGGIAGTDRVPAFLAQEISRCTYINLMDQHHPCYRADEYPQLGRLIARDGYRPAMATAERLGLNRIDQRAAMRR
jgi:putative pyruvate formate lyase activating enzyme